MILTLYDKVYRLLSRIYYRLFGNIILIGKDSRCDGLRIKNVKDVRIALYGKSSLTLEAGVLFKNCNITLIDSELYVSKNSCLDDVSIEMTASKCKFCDNVFISRYKISAFQSQLSVGKSTKLERQEPFKSVISLDNGKLIIGNNNVIRCDFVVRFFGVCSIGQYNCINEGSELRCDESIDVGDYNMISYNCNIWDTNTHCIYSSQKRRLITNEYFPNIGTEIEKPKTSPVKIGSDCWVGKNVSILKGTIISDEVIMGIGSIVSNQIVKKGRVIVPPKAIIIK